MQACRCCDPNRWMIEYLGRARSYRGAICRDNFGRNLCSPGTYGWLHAELLAERKDRR